MSNEQDARLDRIRKSSMSDAQLFYNAALAAERKATVEYIRSELSRLRVVYRGDVELILTNLDAEAARGGLLPTDLTTETSSERGRRDALRHEAGE